MQKSLLKSKILVKMVHFPCELVVPDYGIRNLLSGETVKMPDNLENASR